MTEAVLEPPAARQGPGPVIQPLVEALDVAVSKLVSRTLPGDRRASGVGAGTELAQLRPYQFGDDVRYIDPPASARTGQTHVRMHVPERALTTWIVLDVSPSMAFGTAKRLKADVAEGVALVFGRLGVVQIALIRRQRRLSLRITGLVLSVLLVLVLRFVVVRLVGPVVGVEFGRIQLLGPPSDGAKRLALGAFDFRRIGTSATLQLEVLANCVIQQTHR